MSEVTKYHSRLSMTELRLIYKLLRRWEYRARRIQQWFIPLWHQIYRKKSCELDRNFHRNKSRLDSLTDSLKSEVEGDERIALARAAFEVPVRCTKQVDKFRNR